MEPAEPLVFFKNLLPLAPRECSLEALRLLAAWYSWIDAPPENILAYALEADPTLVTVFCVLERVYSASRELSQGL